MSIAGYGLWPTLLIIGACVLVIAAIAGIVWYTNRASRSLGVLKVTYTLAYGMTILIGLGVVFAIIRSVISDDVSLELPNWFLGETHTIESGSAPITVSTVNVTTTALTVAPRILLTTGGVLSVLALGVPCAVIAILTRRAIDGDPFGPHASRALSVGGIVILGVGTASAVTTALGQGLAAFELALVDAADRSEPVFGFDYPLWTIGAALGLGALAVLFRHGQQLQRDTEGLV